MQRGLPVPHLPLSYSPPKKEPVMSEQFLPCTRGGRQGWGEVEGHVVLHLSEGPRDEKTLLTRNGSLRQGNNEVIGTNCKLCSAQSAVTETAVYKLESLNTKGNNISSESRVTQPSCLLKKKKIHSFGIHRNGLNVSSCTNVLQQWKIQSI